MAVLRWEKTSWGWRASLRERLDCDLEVHSMDEGTRFTAGVYGRCGLGRARRDYPTPEEAQAGAEAMLRAALLADQQLCALMCVTPAQ